MISAFIDIIGAMFRVSTPLLFASSGELISERAGVLNLGIEGTMYVGAFVGIAVAATTGSLWIGLLAAIASGVAAGLLMSFLSVTLGVNQHVAGLGITLALIAVSNTVNRILFTEQDGQVRVDPWSPLFQDLGAPFDQYWLTYAALFLVIPAVWFILNRTGIGLKIRAVGENPEAADAAGIRVSLVRYGAVTSGAALMAIGGAFITLAFIGSFTVDIIAGRGWVALALVIFGRWRVGGMLIGAFLFSFVYALQNRLRLIPEFADIPYEILLALPYVAVIIGLIISGRKMRYPGAYLKPYRRS
jgi:general nucleoside transport system permease protein